MCDWLVLQFCTHTAAFRMLIHLWTRTPLATSFLLLLSHSVHFYKLQYSELSKIAIKKTINAWGTCSFTTQYEISIILKLKTPHLLDEDWDMTHLMMTIMLKARIISNSTFQLVVNKGEAVLVRGELIYEW